MKWIITAYIALIASIPSGQYQIAPAAETRVLAHPGASSVILEPALVPVCACESSFEGTATGTPRQFEPDGKTVRYGRVDPDDRGMCQINRRYHGEAAKALGLDLETADGNASFANHLYRTQGLTPWKWSRGCWGVDR